MLNINDELNVQIENQVLLDLMQHSKTVKLPSIKIKSFCGEVNGMAAIDNSSVLSVVQKFTYLRSYLTDTVLKSISDSTLTNKYYGNILTIFNERCRNKQEIVATHM